MDVPEKIELKIIFEKLDVVDFKITTIETRQPKKGLEFDFNSGFEIDKNNEQIKIILKIRINDSVTKNEICSTTVRFTFTIVNLNKLPKQDKGKEILIPTRLLHDLFSSSYSTLRGILYEKFLGTLLNGVLLPLIDINELIPDSEDGIEQNS